MAGRLFYFNPTCEMAIANGEVSYTPPKHLEKFRNDLSLLPIYFGDRKDVILVDRPASKSFLNKLQEYGWSIPTVVYTPEDIPVDFLPLQKLSPWGWSPAVMRRLGSFIDLIAAPSKMSHLLSWDQTLKDMYSRITGQELSKMIKEKISSHGYLSIPAVPVKVDSLLELIEMEKEMVTPILLKTPWSASGRGLFKIRSRDEGVAHNNWIKSKFKQQGFLMAEPFLHKIQDLSFHFKKEGREISFLGITFFKSEADGRFMGCYIRTPKLPIVAHFPLDDVLRDASSLLMSTLKKIHRINSYNGYIGIDSMLFATAEGELKLHPCIEVNLRYTMGLLNIFLRNRVAPSSNGFWRIVSVNKEEAGSYIHLSNMTFKNNLMAKGQFALTPVPTNGGFMAVATIKEQEFL